MKKNIILLLLFLSQIVLAKSALEIKNDGFNTKFLITRVEKGAVFNEDTTKILLEAHLDTLTTDFEDGLTLASKMWVYPNETFASGQVEYLVHATDLDDVTIDGSQVYLITDQNQGGKVIIYNPNTNQATQTWEDEAQRVPVDASFMGNGSGAKILVTYQSSNSVSVVNFFAGETVWDYNSTFSDPNLRLDSPADAEYVSLNDSLHGFLIADEGNDRILFVNSDNNTVDWLYTANGTMKAPTDVEFIHDTREVLITDKNSNRIIIVDLGAKDEDPIKWSFGAEDSVTSNSLAITKPVDADYYSDGTVYIADAGNDRVLSINRFTNEYWEFHGKVIGVEDVDRLSDGSVMIVKQIDGDSNDPVNDGKHLPAMINFQDEIIELDEVFEVKEGKYVNFTNIFWETLSLPEGTSVEVQFKSSENSLFIDSPWYGPNGNEETWFKLGETELGDFHLGHRYYKFRFYLKTEKRTETPIVSSVSAVYEFYETDPDSLPNVFTYGFIGDTLPDAIVNWKSIRWVSETPRDASKVRFDVRINNYYTDQPIYQFMATDTETEKNLENVKALENLNAIKITARPITDDNSMTPILDYWEVAYNLYRRTDADIYFVNEDDNPVNGYVATTSFPPVDVTEQVDQVWLWVNDDNAELETDAISIDIESIASHDREQADLTLAPPFKAFSTSFPIPIKIVMDSSMVTVENDTFEVYDRDHLIAMYEDQSDSTDVAADTIIVIQSTRGELSVETAAGDPLSYSNLGQQIFVRVSEDNDKNLDLMRQDSLSVTLTNINTTDEERIFLKELPDENGIYNTAEFFSPYGVTVRNNQHSANDDRILYSRGGDIIQVIYNDNYTLRSTVEVLQNTALAQTTSPFVVEAAPNPFYTNRQAGIQLRFSTSSRIRIQQIEIYNLAGELVNRFDHNYIDTFMVSDDAVVEQDEQGYLQPTWWNFKNSVGNDIASGTYWFIVTAELLEDDDTVLETISEMEKVVIVR